MRQVRLSRRLILVGVCVLPAMLGSTCRQTPPERPIEHASPGTTSPGTSSPCTSGIVSPIPAGADGTMILSTEGNVNLIPQGAGAPSPIKEGVWFVAGDTLDIGPNSFAKVLCREGICRLGPGKYDSCCRSECCVVVKMMRVTTGDALIGRAELSPADASAFNDAEKRIRELRLGAVTTQFLMTNLYSGWKLQETNQELDRLTIQLANPSAKEELKELYLPVVRKTGDHYLKMNRVEDAKKLYSINISSASQESGLNQKVAGQEMAAAYTGLAEAEMKTGDNSKEIRSLEKAKDIQLKQGEIKPAEETEKRIVNIRNLQRPAPTP